MQVHTTCSCYSYITLRYITLHYTARSPITLPLPLPLPCITLHYNVRHLMRLHACLHTPVTYGHIPATQDLARANYISYLLRESRVRATYLPHACQIPTPDIIAHTYYIYPVYTYYIYPLYTYCIPQISLLNINYAPTTYCILTTYL